MGRPRLEITEETKAQMRRDSKRMSCEQVAKLYGIGINKTFYIVRGGGKRGCKPKKDSLEYKAIAEDYLNGLSVKKLAKKYHYSDRHIYKILDVQSIDVGRISNRTLSIQTDIKSGEMTQSQIAKKYGISRQRVFTIKKEMESKNADLAL